MSNTDTFTLKEIISRLERMGIDCPTELPVVLTDGEKFIPVDGFFFANGDICLFSDHQEHGKEKS